MELTIKAALRRNALLDADKIQVEVSGNGVILLGKVRSYAEREEVERIAWQAAGGLLGRLISSRWNGFGMKKQYPGRQA